MACFENGTTVDLTARQSLALADIEGTTLRVTRGRVWITQENDTRDIVLGPGETWVVEHRGLTIIEAQASTTLCAMSPVFDRALAAGAPRAQRVARFWHQVRERAKEWYSLSPRRPIPYV